MKLDMDPFPIDMVELEQKKILVRTDQAETIKGRNVVVSDDLRTWMTKATQPGGWNVEGERVEEANQEGEAYVGYVD
jgi:hypothetical protein